MIRYDAMPVKSFERTPQGGLKVQGNLTRTGIFTYRRADGSIRKEYRPPEEVFTQDHLNSFRGAPVTIGHPGVVTADNWKEHAVGHVGDDVRQDEKFAVGTVYIQDAKACASIERGDLKELSCGYNIELDETPGEVGGERYDAIQRNLRGNHVAMGPPGWGRAGSDVALRLDSQENEVREDGREYKIVHERKGLSHVKVKAYDDDTGEETWQHAGSVENGKFKAAYSGPSIEDKHAKRAEKAYAAAQSDWEEGKHPRDENGRFDSEASYTELVMADKTVTPAPEAIEAKEVTIRVDGQAEIDRLSAENQMLQAKVDDLTAKLADDSRMDSLVEERVQLIATAKDVLSAEFKFAGKTAKEIKSAVVLAKNPKFKMDDKSTDDYVNAAYAMALSWEAPVAPHATLGQVRADAHNAAPASDVIVSSYTKNSQANRDAWKTNNRDSLLGK